METSQLSCRAALFKLDAHAGNVQIKDCFLSSLKSLPATFSDHELLEEPEKGTAWQCFAYGYCLYQNACLGCFVLGAQGSSTRNGLICDPGK